MSFEPGTHAIVRTYSAGVFAGTIKSRDGKEAVLTDARRIWYWNGAASLSELATKGMSKYGYGYCSGYGSGDGDGYGDGYEDDN